MELFESIRTESFIILLFYLFLRLCKYKRVIFTFGETNKKYIVFISSIFIIFEASVMKLSGNSYGYFPSGVFIIASGYFSGTLYGIITLLVSSLIISSFSLNLGIGMLISLGAASVICSMLYKKADKRISSLSKIFFCSTFSAITKLLLSLVLSGYEFNELARIFTLDCLGSMIVICIVREYICEERKEEKYKRALAKLSAMNFRNRRLKNIVNAEYRLYRMRYRALFISDTIDKLLEFCIKDTYKAREMIENIKIYIYNSDRYHSGIIKLDKELEILNAYINIIQMRYGEKIVIDLRTKGEISRSFLPAMIIEPVVENSILHGIYPKAYAGEVLVDIEVFNGKTIIKVMDTGIGIDPEINENILMNNNKSLGKIYRRLYGIYKNNFKMEISSRIEDGTTVLYELPENIYYLFEDIKG